MCSKIRRGVLIASVDLGCSAINSTKDGDELSLDTKKSFNIINGCMLQTTNGRAEAGTHHFEGECHVCYPGLKSSSVHGMH